MSTALIPAGDAAIEGVVMMTRAEAEQAERAIITGIDNLREQIATFDDQQGWAALGWESFRAWASSRIPDANLRYLYRLRDANQVDKLLGAAIGHTPESHAREVKGVAPDRVPDVFQRADQIAREQGRDRQARDVAAAKQQVLGGMTAAPKLKPGQEAPIVPEVLVIGERKSYYEPPPLIREAVQYATPNTLRTPGGTRQKHQAYCLPDDAAFERIAVAVDAFGAALTDLAGELRRLGSYAKRLDEAGGMKSAPNPLCESVANIDDPDSEGSNWWMQPWSVPRMQREPIARHTPKMLSKYDADHPNAYVFAQSNCFVLPDDAAWERLQERREAVKEAVAHVDRVLQELGLYSIAQADGRYRNRPAAAPSTPTDGSPSVLSDAALRGYEAIDDVYHRNDTAYGEAEAAEATDEDDAIDPELHEENWLDEDAAEAVSALEALDIDKEELRTAALHTAEELFARLAPAQSRALSAVLWQMSGAHKTWREIEQEERLLDEGANLLAAELTYLVEYDDDGPDAGLMALLMPPFEEPTSAVNAAPATEATPAIVAPGSLFALNDAALREVEESVTLWSEPERLEFAEIRAYTATMVMIVRRGAADDHDRDIVQRLRRRMEDLAEIDDIDDDAWEQLNRDLGEIAAIMAQLETMNQPEAADGR